MKKHACLLLDSKEVDSVLQFLNDKISMREVSKDLRCRQSTTKAALGELFKQGVLEGWVEIDVEKMKAFCRIIKES